MKKLIALSLLLLSSCASLKTEKADYINAYKQASGGQFKLGKPYKVKGKEYKPEHVETLDQIGQASWYGPGFHGKKTANGEKFNTHDLTAAHPTLPIPSIVEVTNLENGKKVLVRINDRGPFAEGRIVDLSKAAAEELDMTKSGLATVRVKLLKEETLDYLFAENLMK